jgi:hypothetical protein
MFTILLAVYVIWTSWAHVWRLLFSFLEPGCDKSHPSTPRERWGKKFPSQQKKLLFAYFVAVLVTWMSFFFYHKRIEKRRLDYARNSYRDGLFDFLSRSYSRAPSRFFHGPNHCSYGFGSWENNLLPRHFGYGPRPHRGDRFPRRPGFPAGEFYTHFEPTHLDGTCFPHRDSCPTGSNGEVQRTMKTSSGHMVKCWIPNIYLTNPSTMPSTFSHPM